MSLAFQNAESVKQALFEELQNLLSSDTTVLQSAEQRIKQLEFTEGYGVYLAEFIMNQSFTLALRQIACIMLKRYVEAHWAADYQTAEDNDSGGVVGGGSGICLATDQAKRMIRNILPNGLYDPNSKIRSSVAHTIAAISTTDYPVIWTELFDIIVKCLSSNEDSIHGAVQILKEFSYDERQIRDLGPVVISEVYRIFESENNYTIKTRTYAICLLRTLFKSISINIMDKQEQQTMMDSILNTFMDKLIHYLSIESGTGSNFLLKTEIIKIFSFLVLDMPKHIQRYMDRLLPVIWQLLTQIADIYVKVVINQTETNPFPSSEDDDEDEGSNFTIMIIQILEFIQTVIVSCKFRTIINNVLTDLIYIMIVYMQVTEEQIEDWNEDPEKFVEDELDSNIELTVRVSAQDVLVALSEEHDNCALVSLDEALARHVNVAQAEKTAGNPNWWKIQEACMYAVHNFRELILDMDVNSFNLINYLTIVRSLLNYEDSAHLVGRAIWTLSTYSKSDIYNMQMLEEILDIILQSLAEQKPIVLKLSAVRAIHGFLLSHEKSDGEKRIFIQTKLPGFVTSILNLVPGCKTSVLGLLLETLTTIINFDPSNTETAQPKLVPLTIAVFLKHPEDPFLIEIVQDMIKALSLSPHCLEPLQEKFIPVILSILSLEEELVNYTKQDIALDILTTIVCYAKAPLSPLLIDNAFPAMVHCVLRTDDHAVMVSGGECLRAFIFAASEQVCNYKNGEGLNYVMQITIMLLNPMNSEMTAGQIGRLVITIITKMGNMLGENIDLLLKAVISKMQLVECLRVIMSLVVIFAHLFLTQMDAVMNFLTTVPGPTGEPAMQFVLSNWLSRQTSFYGLYERKITTMALCKLFEYGITTQDNRITTINVKELIFKESTNNTRYMRSQAANTQEWVSIPALVKIFKLLINELANIKEANVDEYESESEDDTDPNDSAGGDFKSNGVVGIAGNRNSPSKSRYISDLYFCDDDEENTDDDQLTKELMKDPLFQTNMEESLTKFIQNFSNNEHFNMFTEHLNATEKEVLKSIEVKVP